MDVVLTILGLISFLIVVIAIVGSVEVFALAKSKVLFLEDQALDNNKIKANETLFQWTENNNFDFLGFYRIGHYHIAIWGDTSSPTFLWLHSFPDKGIEFITLFEGEILFSTVNSSNWQAPPHFMGYYLQTFSTIDVDLLWQRHVEMENYLIEAGKAKTYESDIFVQEMIDSYRKKQTDHIRSFVAWPIRAIYWNLVSKHFWHNKSIKEQYEKGMIILPNELIENRFM